MNQILNSWVSLTICSAQHWLSWLTCSAQHLRELTGVLTRGSYKSHFRQGKPCFWRIYKIKLYPVWHARSLARMLVQRWNWFTNTINDACNYGSFKKGLFLSVQQWDIMLIFFSHSFINVHYITGFSPSLTASFLLNYYYETIFHWKINKRIREMNTWPVVNNFRTVTKTL